MKKHKNKYLPLLRYFLNSVFIFFLTGYVSNLIYGQCLLRPISSGIYIQNNCGNLHHQISLGTEVPIYGSCGNFYFSPPLTDNTEKPNSVKDTNLALQITPNPAFDYIFLSWPYAEDIDIMIYNQMGQLVSRKWIAGNSTTNTIDIEHLKTGYYVIKAQNSANQIFIHKLIKQ
jgi:hypothetical protein